MIGPVNTMYKGLEKMWSYSEKWLKSCNAKKTDYHEGKFAGNESRTLLNNVEQLQNLVPDEKAMKYVDVFRCFNQVGSPKLHALVYHVGEFCLLTGRGVGPWSEQTGESIHHDFSKTWEKCKIKDIDHPLYGEQLLKAVIMYNSQHL